MSVKKKQREPPTVTLLLALDCLLRVTRKSSRFGIYLSPHVWTGIYTSGVSVITCFLRRFENCPDLQYQIAESFDAHHYHVCYGCTLPWALATAKIMIFCQILSLSDCFFILRSFFFVFKGYSVLDEEERSGVPALNVAHHFIGDPGVVAEVLVFQREGGFVEATSFAEEFGLKQTVVSASVDALEQAPYSLIEEGLFLFVGFASVFAFAAVEAVVGLL